MKSDKSKETPTQRKITRKSKLTDKVQSGRFIEAARKLEIEETGETFERAIKKILSVKHAT